MREKGERNREEGEEIFAPETNNCLWVERQQGLRQKAVYKGKGGTPFF